MKIRSMRSVLFLLAACLVITGMVTAETGVGAQYTISPYEQNLSGICTKDAFPGQPGGTGFAVVEVSGHADTAIDGAPAEPASTGTYDTFPTKWYATTDGSHSIWITRDGYFPVHYEMSACTGKVSYVYYDMAAHLRPGMTAAVTTATIIPATTVPVTAADNGQSGDYGALRNALGTKVPADSLGSLSISTDPEGATIYIDGVQQGISPATIPGISAGTHTLLLKRDGYQDLSLPVVISAGRTHTYTSALLQSGAAPATAATTRKSSTPATGAVVAAGIAGALLLCRKPGH